MNSFKNPSLRRKLIMQHYSNPFNKVDIINNGIEVYSDVCVDELKLKVEVKNNVIINCKFAGQGCAVFLASVDIMLEIIKNKSLIDLERILKSYNNMIHQNGEYDQTLLDKLIVFENVGNHLNRVHCAELIYKALKKIGGLNER